MNKSTISTKLTPQANPIPSETVSTHGLENETNDTDLFLRGRDGDTKALEQLIQRYEQPLFDFLAHVCGGDRHRADDLFQETFLRAMEKSDRYDPKRPFRPWLYTLAVNLARDDMRRRKIGSSALAAVAKETSTGTGVATKKGTENVSGSSDDTNAPVKNAEKAEEARIIQEAIQKLTEVEREVVLLHFRQGLTLSETAEVLQIPLGTVKSRLHAALERLRGILQLRQW